MATAPQQGALTSYIIEENDYCYVNECTIRVHDSNMLLNIINNTGDWITATNTTNLFIAPSNGSECHKPLRSWRAYSDVALYVIQLIIFFLTVIFAFNNILLHLLIKELQTVSGALIACVCLFIGMATIALMVQISLRHQENGVACATAFYTVVTFGFAYELTKLSTLAHFTYLMYCSYKLLEGEINTKLVLKNAFFIIGLTTVLSTIVITIDVFVTRAGFQTIDRSCDLFLSITDIKSVSVVLFLAGLSISTGIDMVLVLIGLILYRLISKHCCVMPKSKDWRVSVALMSTIGYNVCIAVSLYIAQAPGDINYVCTSSGTLIEQTVDAHISNFRKGIDVFQDLHKENSRSTKFKYS